MYLFRVKCTVLNEGFRTRSHQSATSTNKGLGAEKASLLSKKTVGEHFFGRVKIDLRSVEKQVIPTAPVIYPSQKEANQAANKAAIETLMRTEELEAYDINFENMEFFKCQRDNLIIRLKTHVRNVTH